MLMLGESGIAPGEPQGLERELVFGGEGPGREARVW